MWAGSDLCEQQPWQEESGRPGQRSEVRGEVEPLSLSSPLYVMESVSLYVTFSSGLSFA